MPWRSAWTPPRDARATPWNTPPAQAGRLSSSVRQKNSLAVIESTYSYVTDTPDFWRRAYAKYPEHGQRFTGEPAYFKHITEAAEAMLRATHTTAADYRFAVFHQPNTKFPQRVGAQLGFTDEQIATGLLVPVIGNTYAGAAIIGLTAILDIAEPGDRIFMVSFGSGAGSDAFSIRVTDAILERRGLRHPHPGLHRPPHADRLRHVCPPAGQAGDEVEAL